MESPKMIILSNTGKFNQAMGLISESISDKDTKARVSTHIDGDGLVKLDIDTENGVHVSVDTMLSSATIDEPVFVYAYDLCVATRKIRTEKNTVLWVDDGKLYLGAYYNENIQGFELECGFKKAGEFFVLDDFEHDTEINIDQMTFNTIIDSLYEFEYIEIYRKNGIVSFRTGTDRCTIATAMQSATVNADPALSDVSIRMKACTFKTLPLVKAISNELDAVVTIEVDSRLKCLRIKSNEAYVIAGYESTVLETYNSVGLTKLFTIDAKAIAASIDMFFGINYINPTGMVTITAINKDAISIEGNTDERIHVVLSVGEVTVDDLDMKVEIPLDVFTMMIRNSNCPTLTLEADKESRKLMMRYGNGLFMRKCTVSY